jgi:glycosyltransferase involved in cell wall biosynthesis
MSRLHIGFFVSTLITGGAERQLQHLIQHLDSKQFKPYLYTMREPGPVGDLLADAGVPVESNLAPGKPPAPWSILKMRSLWRRDQIDLVFCLDHVNAVVVGTMAARLCGGIPVLMPVHTTGQWNRESIPKAMRMVLPGVARLLSIAEAQKTYLIETEGISEAKITVVRNGIPPLDPQSLPTKAQARAALGIEPDEGPVIGILAMLRPEKAHEHFLAAAREVLTTLPKAVFLLVGGGPRQAELEGLAAELEISDQVHFLGTRSDVPQILPAFDVSVLSSHPKVETLPLSQMEAMSLAIPVVATRVGALHELVSDGVEGNLVPPGDPSALAAALSSLLSDSARLSAAGKAAQSRIHADFTANRLARETEAVMLEVLGKTSNA